jgi:hypothetical protein
MASLKKRGKIYYAQYYVGARQRRVCLHTSSLQIAKEKLRKLESAQARGDETPLPTRTPIADILPRYVEHIRSVKTPKSAQTDIYYLRSAFGPICEAVKTTSRTGNPARRPTKPGQDNRCKTQVIEASCFEQITTAEIASFIGSQVRSRGLAPKTANRFREIICRLFNWAMMQGGIRMPCPYRECHPGRERALRHRASRDSDIGFGQMNGSARSERVENHPIFPVSAEG